MLHRVLRIGRWIVDFLFAVDGYDVEGILACMYDCGASAYAMEQAERLMEECDRDCGFTFANPVEYRAVVMIGPSSSGEEFQNTLVHEIHHLAVAIAAGLGIDLEGETPAYLAGDSAMALADVICGLGCGRCHH